MKYDFSKISVTDVDGNAHKKTALKPIHQIAATKIYNEIRDVGLVEPAIAMNKGESVEFDKGEAKAVRKLLCGEQSTLFAFIRKAISDYMDSVEKEKKS